MGTDGSMATHSACTKHEAVAGSNAYKYKTVVSLTMPADKVTDDATLAAIETQAEALVEAEGAATLKTMLVVSAVRMSEDPAVAAQVNFTESFGLSSTELTAAAAAVQTSGSLAELAKAPPAAVATASSSVDSAVVVPVFEVPTTAAPTTPTPSGAQSILTSGAIIATLLALVF